MHKRYAVFYAQNYWLLLMDVVYWYQGKGNDQDKETENQEVRKIPMGFLFTEQQTFGVKAICN